ncbi:dethiobiotin synthase [Succinimonas amylolytica]|uniref:dethiobiotin synthase n=1 Tax=Succinimonas amylolytica TaxID=83769 RepID=UPI0023A8DB11
MTKMFFITGTDTDAGKTFCACALEAALRERGYSVRPYKPIAAGLEANGSNQDISRHLEAVGLHVPQSEIAALIYREPVAPHIAARKTGKEISFADLDLGLKRALSDNPDYLITEGAGGWLLPLGGNRVLPDWPGMRDMQVIIVVGMKLGCLNHALLTREAVVRREFRVGGFITHSVSAELQPYYQENLETLQEMMGLPFLGDVRYEKSANIKEASSDLNLDLFLSL